MPRSHFMKFDLKKFNDLKSQLPKGASEALDKFQTQISTYEERVKDLIHNLEERREKVRHDVQKLKKERLNQFANDLKKTRNTVEKRVLNLVGDTRKELQTRVNDLVIYLTGLAGKDVLQTKKKTSGTKKSTKKTSGSRKSKAKRINQLKNAHRSSSAAEGISPA